MSITTTTTTIPATSVSITPAADPDAHCIANMKGAGATADPLVHTRKMLRSRLGSGLRTAFACLIVGLTTVYGPTSLRRHLPFPAFAYVTAVLIAGEATTGDSLRGAVHSLYGIMLSMLPTILSLMTFGHRNFSVMTTTMAVVLGSFVVTLPESTSLITKRIALGHIVLVYVEVYKRGIVGGAVLHPGHAAASTSVGVVAAVLAVLLPYPRLASREVMIN